jgi:hypothetical protein
VLGPDGLSRFEGLRRQEAASTAILYTVDLIAHDAEESTQSPVPPPQGHSGATAARNRPRHFALKSTLPGQGASEVLEGRGMDARQRLAAIVRDAVLRAGWAALSRPLERGNSEAREEGVSRQ